MTQTGATFGHSAIYSCNPGYTMLGAPNRVCNFDGTWTGVVPTCSKYMFIFVCVYMCVYVLGVD